MTSSKNTAFAAGGTYAGLGQRSGAAAADPAPGGPVESAWQRWEMQSLTTPASRRTAARPANDAAPATAPRPPAPSLDEKLLARLRIDARTSGEAEGRRQGWAQGHSEGLIAGHTEGRAEGLALASAHAEELRALTHSLPVALRRAEAEMSDALVALALDVARQVVHHSLAVDPGWIVSLVQQQLHAEPALQGEPRLLLHPEDVILVRSSLGHELQAAGWQLRADETITRGGCRVQCAGSEVDATLETRLARVTAALGGETKVAHD